MIGIELRQEINRFLDGEGYYTWGVELLERLGYDKKVVQKLRVYCKADYAPIEAENELMSILRGYSTDNGNNHFPKDSQKGALKDSNQPQRIIELENDKIRLLKLRADWHTRLKITEKQSDRAYYAEMILNTQKSLDKVFMSLDIFYKHGIEPIDTKQSNEVVSSFNEKSNLASRISKIRRLLNEEKMSKERREELNNELLEKEQRFQKVKDKLKTV